MAAMKSGSSGSGTNSISYQPKKLLKLPKEVPSNIVRLYLFSKFNSL